MDCCNRCTRTLEDDDSDRIMNTTPALGESYVLLSNSISSSSLSFKSPHPYHTKNAMMSTVRSWDSDRQQSEEKNVNQQIESCSSMDVTSVRDDFAPSALDCLSGNSIYARPSLLEQQTAHNSLLEKNATPHRQLKTHKYADMSHHEYVMTSRHALW